MGDWEDGFEAGLRSPLWLMARTHESLAREVLALRGEVAQLEEVLRWLRAALDGEGT